MKMKAKEQSLSKFKPVKMKRVLIALDYDPSAQKVAETGYSLARSMKAEITLLHIIGEIAYYSSPEYSPIMGFIDFSSAVTQNLIEIEKVKKASGKFLEKIREHLRDETIRIEVAEGDTADSIIKTADALDADLIVIGTHGRKGFEKMVMGSVAEKVLHHTSKPLFIVPTKKNK